MRSRFWDVIKRMNGSQGTGSPNDMDRSLDDPLMNNINDAKDPT